MDKSYKIPSNEKFQKREFSKIRWGNIKSRNFLVIMKILAENGFCTVSDIIEKDGLSHRKDLRKIRHDEYDRVIKGEEGKFLGLIEKGLIQPKNPDWGNTKNNKYRLSILGVFYAIRLFSKPKPTHHFQVTHQNQIEYEQKIMDFMQSSVVKKYKKSILDVLVENYSDMLPLIFGKWILLTMHIGSMVNILVDFAHSGGPTSHELDGEPLFNSRPLYHKNWKSKNGIYVEEITLWFFGSIVTRLTPRMVSVFLSKNKDILKWYTKYLTLRSKVEREHQLRINYAKYVAKGQLPKAKQAWKSILALQKIDQSYLEPLFN